MVRKINELGLAKIKQFEALKLKAYQDSVGVWTIGYGHTAMAGPPPVHSGMVISEKEANDILNRDLAAYEASVEKAVKVKLTDNQFAALVSFCYNVGPGNFEKSTLVKKLNAGDYDSVPRELAKWNRAGGKVLKGLTNRRAAEAGLWAKGEFVASRDAPAKPAAPPVVTVDNAIKVGTGVSGLLQAITSSTAQIIFVTAFCLGAAFLAYRWYRAHREASS